MGRRQNRGSGRELAALGARALNKPPSAGLRPGSEGSIEVQRARGPHCRLVRCRPPARRGDERTSIDQARAWGPSPIGKRSLQPSSHHVGAPEGQERPRRAAGGQPLEPGRERRRSRASQVPGLNWDRARCPGRARRRARLATPPQHTSGPQPRLPTPPPALPPAGTGSPPLAPTGRPPAPLTTSRECWGSRRRRRRRAVAICCDAPPRLPLRSPTCMCACVDAIAAAGGSAAERCCGRNVRLMDRAQPPPAAFMPPILPAAAAGG